MDKISKNKNEKYLKILSAAFELFSSKEFGSVSIDEIVKKAGIAKGTFYLYFKDKVDLISKIILNKATEYLKTDIEVTQIKNDDEFNKCLIDYFDYLIFFLENNLTLTALIDKNVHFYVNTILQSCDGPLKELYNNIIEYFENKGFGHEEVRIKMYIYIDMTVSSYCNAILRKQPYKLEELKPYLLDIIKSSIFGAEKIKEAIK